MPLWLWIMFAAALVKIPLAGLMLWIPFRNDEAMRAPDVPDSSDEDGGSKALPAGPRNPHPRSPRPRSPRRGPHGSPSPGSPRRVRSISRMRSRRRAPLRVSH
jgi:hypothetical protein